MAVNSFTSIHLRTNADYEIKAEYKFEELKDTETEVYFVVTLGQKYGSDVTIFLTEKQVVELASKIEATVADYVFTRDEARFATTEEQIQPEQFEV